MAVINGASVVQENRNESGIRYDAVGKNSEVIAVGDLLTIQAGIVAVATATQVIHGIAVRAATMASTNQTVAKVAPPYVPITDSTILLMGTNADLTGNVTDGGTYYKIIGLTSVMQVDVSSGVQTGASRIVEIVKVDPFNAGGSGSGSGLRTVYVRIVKTPYSNVQITA